MWPIAHFFCIYLYFFTSFYLFFSSFIRNIFSLYSLFHCGHDIKCSCVYVCLWNLSINAKTYFVIAWLLFNVVLRTYLLNWQQNGKTVPTSPYFVWHNAPEFFVVFLDYHFSMVLFAYMLCSCFCCCHLSWSIFSAQAYSTKHAKGRTEGMKKWESERKRNERKRKREAKKRRKKNICRES